MALIGLKYPVYAPITTYTEGTAITYGTGAVVSHAVTANLSQNRRDNVLWADDIKVETDNGLIDYSITLEVDDVPNTALVGLLGETDVQSGQTPAHTHYAVTGDAAPYVGFGYIRVLMRGGVKYFEGFWCHRVQFSLDSVDATTKKEQIDFGTPKLTGKGHGVLLDNSGKEMFYDHEIFTTEAAAKTWVKGRANIT